MPDKGIIQNFTAKAGDRVVLPCPIQPGALRQSYSVIWKKDNDIINHINDRYDIDAETYALVIDPVSVSDSSTNYQCDVSVEYPSCTLNGASTKQILQYYNSQAGAGRSVSLSLTVTQCSKLIHN